MGQVKRLYESEVESGRITELDSEEPDNEELFFEPSEVDWAVRDIEKALCVLQANEDDLEGYHYNLTEAKKSLDKLVDKSGEAPF